MTARQRNLVLAIASLALVAIGLIALALRGRGSSQAAPVATSARVGSSTAPTSATNPTTSATTDTTAVGPDRCHTSQLTGAYVAYGEGAAGNHRFDLRLTNTSSQPCAVTGYPGIGFLTSTHQTVNIAVGRGSGMLAQDPGPTRILLSPGETATASVAYAIQCNEPATAARPGYVEVTPPDEPDFVLTTVDPPENLYLCADSKVEVTALIAGTTGASTH